MSSISNPRDPNKIRGFSLLEQAEFWAATGRIDCARRCFSEAIQSDPTGAARLRFGEFLCDQGQHNEAAWEFSQALDIGRGQHNHGLSAAASQFLAAIFREQGQTALAESYHQQAIAAGLRGQHQSVADCPPLVEFSALANAAISRGDLAEAARLADFGVNYAKNQHDLREFADAWGTGAAARLLLGDHKAAWRGFLKSYAAHCLVRDQRGRIADLLNLAEAARRHGWWTVTHRLLTKAGKLARQTGANHLMPRVARLLDEANRVLAVADREPEWN